MHAHLLGNRGHKTGESKVQRLVSHPRSFSLQLSSLLWSVLTPCDPPAVTRDGKVASETRREKSRMLDQQICVS